LLLYLPLFVIVVVIVIVIFIVFIVNITIVIVDEMNSNTNSSSRNHVFHSFRHFPNLKIPFNQAEIISNNKHHNHHIKKEFYDTTFRIGKNNDNNNTNTNTDRPCLYHIEKELKTLKKSSIKVLKTDMDRFRTTLIHGRDKERGIIKKIVKATTRPICWNDNARSCLITDFRPPLDGNEYKPKGYGTGYGYGERGFYKQTTANINNTNQYDDYDDDDDNFDALQSVAEKLMNNLGIDINDHTLLSLLNDNGDYIYNWQELQHSIHSYLGIKITNEEAQVLMSRLH